MLTLRLLTMFTLAGLGSALAQTAPAPAPAPAPVAAEQRPPQLAKTEISNLDNWQLTCQEFINPARRQCSAAMQLIQTNPQANTANVVVNWQLQPGEGQIAATIQTPTGILLTPGIELKAGKTMRKLAYTRCDPQRCEAAFPIDEAFSKELAAADTAEVLIRNLQNAPVAFTIPMKGYDRASQGLRR